MTPTRVRSADFPRLTPAQRRELALVAEAGPEGLSGGTGSDLRIRRELARLGLVAARLDAIGGGGSGITLQRFAATEAGRSALRSGRETKP